MAENPSISDVITDITADVKTIVRSEIALAKAELMPQAKKVGIGAGLFGVAAVSAVVALMMLFIAGSFALAGLYLGVMAPVWAYSLGFVTMAVVLLVIAGILALIGKGQVTVPGPEKTIETTNEAIASVEHAIKRGQANVEATGRAGTALPPHSSSR